MLTSASSTLTQENIYILSNNGYQDLPDPYKSEILMIINDKRHRDHLGDIFKSFSTNL